MRAAADDKTRVAVELAFALSTVPHTRTLIMEGDLNRPRLHSALGISVPVGTGLSNQLHHKAQGNAAPDWKVTDLGNGLHALTEGALRAPGLVLSTVFEQAVGALRGYYDHIVIDGPFESELVEGRALSSLVDGVIRISPEAVGEVSVRPGGMA
jgi:Mrp family chromosome partitioning ATPase